MSDTHVFRVGCRVEWWLHLVVDQPVEWHTDFKASKLPSSLVVNGSATVDVWVGTVPMPFNPWPRPSTDADHSGPRDLGLHPLWSTTVVMHSGSTAIRMQSMHESATLDLHMNSVDENVWVPMPFNPVDENVWVPMPFNPWPRPSTDADILIVIARMWCVSGSDSRGSAHVFALGNIKRTMRVVPSRNFPRTWTWGWVRDGDEMMWGHILVTFRHIAGSIWRCQVSKKLFLELSWNLVQMWRFRHIVTSFFWVRLGTKHSFKTWPGPGFWVSGFPIPAWNDPQWWPCQIQVGSLAYGHCSQKQMGKWWGPFHRKQHQNNRKRTWS